MTESEAKLKWCPFTRQRSAHGDGSAINRGSDGSLVGKCVAGACMAWRQTRQVGEEHGFCGLAEAPKP